jgi:AhpD family alkylhydroperoxidase
LSAQKIVGAYFLEKAYSGDSRSLSSRMSPRLPSLPPHLPGMMALGAYRPDIYAKMGALADSMLRTGHPESTLVPSEREMIASYVSSLNNCKYCATVHGAVAAAHMCTANTESTGGEGQITEKTAEEMVNTICIKGDVDASEVEASPKLKRLLQVAAQVRESGQKITPEAIAEAKKAGATDMDIHDTVLIAALFCMWNRYVDGLTGDVLGDIDQLKGGGRMLAEHGYAPK